jgi:hypothetical protein
LSNRHADRARNRQVPVRQVLPAIAEEEVMDTWEASLESYFTGWRDGYAQALDDVDSVIDEQRDGG